MAAKKKEAPKKRIKPVVEEVVETVQDQEQVQENTEPAEATETPNVETPQAEEVVEEVVESADSDSVSIEPDFASTESSTEEPTAAEEMTPQAEASAPALTPTPAPASTNKMSIKTILFITLISALVAAFVSGGVYVYLTGVSDMKVNNEETADSEAQPEADPALRDTPSPTPVPVEETEVEFSEYSVQVLNGSGQIGAAGAGSDLVEAKGFVVDDTGNADNYDYESTVVQVKESVSKAALEAVIKALEEDYEVEEGDKLEDDNEYDIIITVGTK